MSRSERAAILSRTSGKCAYCGCDLIGSSWQVDHFHPRMQPVVKQTVQGIPHHTTSRAHEIDVERFENKLPACRSCNVIKTSNTIEQFRYRIENFITGFNRDYPKYRMCKRYGLLEETGARVVFEFERQGIKMPSLDDLKESSDE